MEKLFKPMIKRNPLPYAPGQNVVSDVEKAMRYADEPDRIQFKAFEVTFDGDNSAHHTSLSRRWLALRLHVLRQPRACAVIRWRWSASSKG